jgi:lipoprotein LpqH
VKHRKLAVIATALTIGAISGCAQHLGAQPAPGALPPGTAEVKIDNQDLGSTYSVACTPVGTMTTISTGEAGRGTTSVVENATNLLASSVELRNLGGFSGSYWQGFEDQTKVRLTDNTYSIAGTATGFRAEDPATRVSVPFAIRVSC